MTSGDSAQWAGSLHWPLAPFGLVVNDLALCFPGNPCLQAPFELEYSADAREKHKNYLRHFLLLPSASLDYDSPGSLVGAISDGLKDDKNLGAVYRTLAKAFKAVISDQDVSSVAMLYPQTKDMPELVISELWKEKKPELRVWPSEHVVALTPKQSVNTGQTCNHRLFIAYSEALLPKLNQLAPHVRALTELRQNESSFTDLLASSDTMTSITYPLPILCSFFADEIVDAALIVPLQVTSLDSDAGAVVQKSIQGTVHSLLMLLHAKRLEWLDQWLARLPDAMAEEYLRASLYSKDEPNAQKQQGREDTDGQWRAKEAAIQFATNAIFTMVRVLAWIETDESTEQVNEYWRGAWKESVEKADCTSFLQACNSNLAAGRKSYINQFFYDALAVSSQWSLEWPAKHLHGVLSQRVANKLYRLAERLPERAIMTLSGAPGGGKSLASREYHTASMRAIFGWGSAHTTSAPPTESARASEANTKTDTNTDKSAEQALEWIKVETDRRRTGHQFRRYWLRIHSALDCLFGLPGVRELRNHVHLHIYFLRQIQGTHWWAWAVCRQLKPDYFRTRDEISIGDGKKIYDEMARLIGVKGIPLSGTDAEVNKPARSESGLWPSNPVLDDVRKALIGGYLIRLALRMQEELASNGDFEFNWRHVNCGSLGAEGEEYFSSLRRLFGSANAFFLRGGEDEIPLSVPGLFQTCALMGGTLCLDEIARCPVCIQDNLLGPLESGKVFRVGFEWFEESVRNVRVVASSSEGFDDAVRLFEETRGSPAQRGLRPDLRDRLLNAPPVAVKHVLDYFVYEDCDDQKAFRSLYRAEFARLMVRIGRRDAGEAGVDRKYDADIPDILTQWSNIYDVIDEAILRKVDELIGPEGRTLAERKRLVARRLPMRFLAVVARMLQECVREDDGGNATAQSVKETMAYLRSGFLPESLDFFLRP